MVSCVRAKMYVSAINRSSYTADAGPSVNVHLNCVMSPDPSKEDHSFWKATPNGSGKFVFWEPEQKDDVLFFQCGEKYYIDFVRNDESGEFFIERIEKDPGYLQVVLCIKAQEMRGQYCCHSKRFEFWIDNKGGL